MNQTILSLARLVIIAGVILIVIGALLYMAGRWNITGWKLPLGRLPGDIRIQTENFTCIFPLATSILISIILTVLLNIIVRIFK